LEIINYLCTIEHKMGNQVSYWLVPAKPVAVGIGKSMSGVKNVKNIVVDMINVGGPYDKGSGEVMKVTEFWKDRPVVLHLLRRFG